jgi:hypothetical protein
VPHKLWLLGVKWITIVCTELISIWVRIFYDVFARVAPEVLLSSTVFGASSGWDIGAFSVLLVDGCAGLALLISFLSFQTVLLFRRTSFFTCRKPIGKPIDAQDSFSSTKTYST